MSNETNNGRVWLNNPDDLLADALIELDDADITAERTEDDEVAIHATLDGDPSAVVSLYLTPAAGALLAARLTAVAVAEETTRRPRYAPAREDGLKPYVVTVSSWGRSYEVLEYAAKPNEAEYAAKGRQLRTFAKARRATPDDMDRLGGAR